MKSSDNIAKIAGAGSGKTTGVALDAAFMIAEGIDPKEPLLITLSDAGAGEKQEKPAGSHPAPWAVFEADNALMEKFSFGSEQCEDLAEALDDILYEEIASDEGREAANLADLYIRCNKDARMLVDAALVYLCGWSMPTLMRKAIAATYPEEGTPEMKRCKGCAALEIDGCSGALICSKCSQEIHGVSDEDCPGKERD